MLTELQILLPSRLLSTGHGILALPIKLKDRSLLSVYRIRCRIEGLPESSEYVHFGEFSRSGSLSLTLPGNLTGGLNAIVDVSHRNGGGHLNGAFRIEVAYHSASGLQVHVEGHSGTGANYQPVEVHGQESKSVEVIGTETLVTVPLEAEAAEDAVSLSTLAEWEECLMLPELGDGITRIFQLCVGENLTLGRCYTSEIGEEAKGRLEREQLKSVDWVSSWDDPLINRLSLTMCHQASRLELKNLSDYSPKKRPKTFQVEHLGQTRILEASSPLLIDVDNQSVVNVIFGEGSRSRTLLRFNFEDIPVGDFAIPVYRTEKMSFRLPPEGGTGSVVVHFLGLWLPWSLGDLEKMFRSARQPLSAPFPGEDFSLWFRWSPQRKQIVVSSNLALRECLGA